ncbi:hypothetical protein CNMCM8927_008439 [Aspergillus lentulus]|uniref:FAS1 domain-containing protein n=1 Tax=Aspergillus lentulus TaxID=293939 RepID=A0AAN5YMA0_ASPLE|nr:hypothetical protein CNMCM8060_008644 [Aspergillus lentulus]KAF4185485.1 hypothetical protein CNMCM7927_006692 [Aspergillus lentulus]KAF4193318.1 hypothetical protein CNMCM8694_009019 [Aspergillus lentulus]KAF4203676.1 hypothetical protein CNMCM8927_008439 [Aspergillus lentulus]
MKLIPTLLSCLTVCSSVLAATEDPLNYRNIKPSYVAPKLSNTTTLLEFIRSRSDLSRLSEALDKVGGFSEAFSTDPTWKFTFFAPNNDAFETNVGRYFNTFESTPKGKWWLGNTILHHYVPNTNLKSSNFNGTYQQFQTATFLYVGAEVQNGNLLLNKVATVVEKDIAITQGVVHIIDRILDPSAQIFEGDLSRISQAFIPGSCSNPNLPYC